MGDVAALITAVASMVSSVGGIAAFLYTARRTSRLERERAAERAAERLLHPEDAEMLDAAIESMFHPHVHGSHHKHEIPGTPEGKSQEGEPK